MNIELFKKIHDVISVEPKRLWMSEWESECGTSRCVAGWAAYLTVGVPLYTSDGEPDPAYAALQEDLFGKPVGVDFAYLARKLLGLPCGASRLFYRDDQTAAQFVHLAAYGRVAEAMSLLDLDENDWVAEAMSLLNLDENGELL